MTIRVFLSLIALGLASLAGCSSSDSPPPKDGAVTAPPVQNSGADVKNAGKGRFPKAPPK